MASSIKKVVAEGPEFDVTVHFMDNGGVRVTLPMVRGLSSEPLRRARVRVKFASSRSRKGEPSSLAQSYSSAKVTLIRSGSKALKPG
jgi:hypothetical protein